MPPDRERLERRRASIPADLGYPGELPVVERREDILEALGRHQVVVVAGETGSGKTTQLPKICLEAGLGIRGVIGHTQPRRIAARTVAERMAEELRVPLGRQVGYAVRFTDRVGPETLIKVMTDGILLTELRRDRRLSRYDAIIVDEAHERSLNIDFILGYLKSLLPRRPDLKVIVTSATIDTERFSRHFSGAPVIEVSGRAFPVEVRYRPPEGSGEPGGPGGIDGELDQVTAIADAVRELMAEGPGDLLVFLSGEREIRDTAEALRRLELPGTEILPLYARLSAAEQHRVFQAHRGRRVVLATNVAETSITVPGIRYVVDPGTARISRYSRRTKVQRLPIEPISQASANQRAGRCGRVGPGICVRLYDQADFGSRPQYTDPEILRTNLASVILQMAAIGLGDVAAFPFVDPPDRGQVKDGIALLEELGALDPGATDPGRRLTPLGRRLAQLPVDPRLGRMVIEAERNGCFREVIVIAAALSIQDPRERPADRRQVADEAHARFRHPDSDFLTYLNLWQYLQEQQAALSSSQFRKLCRSEFLNHQRIREWQDICSQLRQVGREVGLRANSVPAAAEVIHRSLLSGLLSHLGLRDPVRREYLGAHNARFALAPGSVLFKGSPRWVMAAELVETNRLWARTVARVRPEWAESLAPHLVRREYSEPHWDSRRASAMAYERVTLYGLPIVTARRVSYVRIGPEECREMFIRHALVEADWQSHHRFVEHNREMLEEAHSLQEKSRRRDLLVSEEELFAFFDGRIPPEVVSGPTFDRWWNQARKDSPQLLDLTLDVLIAAGPDQLDPASYPERWDQDGLSLALTYELDPQAPFDGVSVRVPLPLLSRVSPAGFDWQVPGLRLELVTALIRSLPKGLRRHFVPAGDHARRFLEVAAPPDGPLLPVLAGALTAMGGVEVSASDLAVAQLPPHLRMTFVAEDAAGRVLDADKDLGALRSRLGGRARREVASTIGGHEQDGLTTWSIGPLPRVVERAWEGRLVRAYPALLDAGSSVSVRLLASEADQARAMRRGTRRLLLLNSPGLARALRSLSNRTKLAISRSPYGTVRDLVSDCAALAVDRLVEENGGPAWDEKSFSALLGAVRAQLGFRALEVIQQAGLILEQWRALTLRLEAMPSPALRPAVEDMTEQLAGLVHAGFVLESGDHLEDLPRYLSGIERRLDKLADSPGRDAAKMRVVRSLGAELARARRVDPDAAAPGDASDLGPLRWSLEELRISLFAQTLGTPEPVSEQRIRRALAGLG